MLGRERLLATCLMCLLLVSVGLAQVNAGRITGTITDNSGAVVTNATVTATRPDTGASQVGKTNTIGEFNFPFLAPTTYNLQIEAPGFARQQQKGIVLAVGQVLTLNFTLKPGSASEVIEVTGEAPLVETNRSDIGGNVSPAEVSALPVRDRNFSSLMTLVPGVRPASNFDPTKSRSGNASVNGGDGRSFDYNVDGGDNKDNVIGGIVQNYTLEGIQEFNVVTDRYTADSGRTVGGVVNVVTKSGTNTFHGSGFGEFQNSYFNANSELNRDANGNQLPKENFKRYHMGGSFGGPIIKDKFFFFGAYEYKRELAKIHPDAVTAANLALVPFAELATNIPTPFYQQLATIKLDYKISNRQSIFMRYGRERWITDNDQPASSGGNIGDLSEATANTNQFHSMVVQHNLTISSTKVNAISFQFQDFANTIKATPGRTFTYTPGVVGGGVTVTNPLITFPGGAELGNNINVPQETLIRKWQFRDDFSWVHGRHTQKFGGNAIYLSRLGGYFFSGLGYQAIFNDDPLTICDPTKNCNTAGLAPYTQGLSTPGAVQELIYSSGDGRTNNPQQPTLLGLYYQDDFKATPHLTLNLGLRWDVNINFLNAQLTNDPLTSNRVVNILRQAIAANPASPATAAGLARAQYLAGNVSDLTRKTADWKEFQPRVGFAWDPTGRGNWVVRGGFGIARDQIFQNLTLWSIQQSNPTLYQSGLIDLTNNGRPGTCTVSPANPLCTFRFGVDALPAAVGAPTDLAFGARGRLTDPNITDPWAEQFSIGASHQFHPDYAVSVDYYHVLGFHEFYMLDDNPKLTACQAAFGGNPNDPVNCPNGSGTRLLDPLFVAAGLGAGRLSQIRTAGSTNRSLFDSVNFVLNKRMTHNFMFRASYVLSWSRAWGGQPVASYGGSYHTVTREDQFLPNNWGPTDNDERHRFVFSGVFNLPYGFELAPLFQAASARPVQPWAATDLNGDGRTDTDRVCAGFTPPYPAAAFTPGCTMATPNSLRGFPFVQMDLTAAKNFTFGERVRLRLFWEFHNLFNHFNKCNAVVNDASSASFLQPISGPISGPYCAVDGGTNGVEGGSFGPGFSSPFRSQFGLRVTF